MDRELQDAAEASATASRDAVISYPDGARRAAEAYAAARLEDAIPLVVGQIIIGEEDLRTLIPGPAEFAVWTMLHARATRELGPTKMKVVHPDGSLGLEPVFFPSMVKEYLGQLARNAALNGAVTKDAAAGGKK